MSLDIRTILIVTFIHSTLIGLGLLISAREYSSPMRKSMLAWGYGLYILAFSWIFLGLRNVIPDLWSIVVGNVCGLIGLVELYQSVRLFDGKLPNRKWLYSFTAIAIAVTVFFYVGMDSLAIRVVVVSSSAAFLLALTGWRLLFPTSAASSTIRVLSGLGCWILAIFWLIRSLDALFFHSDMTTIWMNTPLQTLVFGGTIIGTTAVTLGYLSLCSHQLNSELKQMVIMDALSGLYNRRAIIEFAEREIARSHRSQEPLALIIIDIDNLKPVNDTYGHGAGDATIIWIANLLKGKLREGDVIGRIGGDEFVALLPNTSLTSAEQIARRLSLSVEANPVIYKDNTIGLSICTGTAVLAATESDYDELLSRADQALYSAKQYKREQLLSQLVDSASQALAERLR
jgi:diguanylate cyclase (GGDEF)-like protein